MTMRYRVFDPETPRDLHLELVQEWQSEVVIELKSSVGTRCLRLGPGFRVARGAALHAELDALLGGAMLSEVLPSEPAAVAEPVAASA